MSNGLLVSLSYVDLTTLGAGFLFDSCSMTRSSELDFFKLSLVVVDIININLYKILSVTPAS